MASGTPPLYRRVFSSASVGLSYGAASVTFHGLSRLFPAYPGGNAHPCHRVDPAGDARRPGEVGPEQGHDHDSG